MEALAITDRNSLAGIARAHAQGAGSRHPARGRLPNRRR
jgi:hypothetical protein